MEVEGPVLLFINPSIFKREEPFFFVPSTSKNLEAQGPSYTECPLPPNFWRLRVQKKKGSSRLKIEGLVKSSTGPPTSACTLNLLNIGGRGTEVEGTEAEGT